ncbi:hypothetical protein UFOVP635_9 [uncultured Caudovirales phage]|uniref:Uncharacterized protein n=1 Tax=uncultured Caudovirales phage TaxID=2100421 RepID=A0A6J5N6A9_9CAUD|nr:hypothetical protein UFOVP635_9 [uncultured Caudovirales phage]
MAKRIIKYVPKITGAKTEYREINEADMNFIQSELIRWLATMSELDMARDPDSKWTRDSWWHKRTDTLPRGHEGQNTPASFVGGMIMNVVYGTQRDLSDKQMDALTNISHIMGECMQGCTSFNFQIGFERNGNIL